MSPVPDFKFILNPEPRQTKVEVTPESFVDIAVTAQNRSGRPVRVQAILEPLDMQSTVNESSLTADFWSSWLEIRSQEPEWDFESGGVRTYTVRIKPPSNARLGIYRFRLLISGVANPDEEFSASDPIIFTIAGPELNLRPFIISASIFMALLVLLIIGLAVILKPRPSLKITLDAPPEVKEGETAQYTLLLQNQRDEPASNVMVDYHLPKTVIAASAFMRGETVRSCESHDRQIHCELGTLAAEKNAEIVILAIPGPMAEVITNTRTMTVSAQLAQTVSLNVVKPNSSQEKTKVIAAAGKFSAALNASTLTPLFAEDFTYDIWAWSDITSTQAMTFTFTLPVGMRYEGEIPVGCSHIKNDYFTILCTATIPPAVTNENVKRISIRAKASSITNAPATLKAITNKAPDVSVALQRSVQTHVVNSALFFNGVDNWAQLGYHGVPKTLTVEMWVHPYSSDDGQSFIGLHQEVTDTVHNIFLVGYWYGGINININGELHNLAAVKPIERFHLAVVVENLDNNSSRVTAYINGVEQEWLEPEESDTCDRCKIFAKSLPGGENELPWVLGQDYDPGSQGKRLSDFFHGTLAEVRIWQTARTKNEIEETYQSRPRGNEPGLVAYYRLEPIDADKNILANRANPSQPGIRIGATWVEAAPLFGTALQFNGFNDSIGVPGLQLANFAPDANGEVEVTMSGWIMVNAIPSQQEWILGSTVPSGSTLSLADSAGAAIGNIQIPIFTDQSALINAQSELLTAQQNAGGLGLDASSAAVNSYNARQRLILALATLQNDPMAQSADSDLKRIKNVFPSPITPQQLPYTNQELGSLAVITSTQNIAGYASALQNNLARITTLSSELETLPNTPTALPAPSSAVVNNPLLQALLKQILLDIASEQDFVNGTPLYPGELNSPYPDLIIVGRKDEYAVQLSDKISKVIDIINQVQNNPSINVKSLETFAAQVNEVGAALGSRIQELQTEVPRYAYNDPFYIQINARLVLIERFSSLITNTQRVLSQAAQTAGDQTTTNLTNALIPPLPASEQQQADRSKLTILLTMEQVSASSNLQALIKTASDINRLDLLTGAFSQLASVSALEATGERANQVAQGGASINHFPPMHVLFLLSQIDRLEKDLVSVPSPDDQSGAARIQTFQSLQTIQTDLDQAMKELSAWLQPALNHALEENMTSTTGALSGNQEVRAYIANLASAQYNLQEYQNAQAALIAVQAAELQVADAQEKADEIQAQSQAEEKVAAETQAESAQLQQLENEVTEASLAVQAAHTPEEKRLADIRLEKARSARAVALTKQYINLNDQMEALQVRETTIADLAPRLNTAVDRATDAAVSAARRYSVERWIGPYLDYILHTTTRRTSAQETIRSAALLAAQVALKNKNDSAVDIAQSELAASLAKQNNLVNSGSNSQLRQQIIDQINAYLDSLNKDVDASQKKLDEALAAQQGDQGESEIPLVLAEALAQTVADHVASETIRLTPRATISSLLASNAILSSQVKQNVRARITAALEITRRPVRIKLYYQTAYMIARLDAELASGRLSSPEQKLKKDLRVKLADSNLALQRLLDSQNSLLRPESGLTALMGQVASQSQAAADLDTLLKNFQDALKTASQSLQRVMTYTQAQGQFILPSGSSASATTVGNSTQPGTGGASQTVPTNGSSSGTASPELTAEPANSTNPNTTSSQIPEVTLGSELQPTSSNTALVPAEQQDPTAALLNTINPDLALAVTSNPSDTGSSGSNDALVSGETISETQAAAAAIQPPNIWLGLMVDTDGHVMAAAQPANSSTWSWLKDEKPIPVLQWVHYALVVRFNAQTGAIISLKLLRYGSPVKGDASGSDPTFNLDSVQCPQAFYIGGLCDTQGEYYFAGRIDEVRVWNRALDPKEVDAWRNLPNATYDEIAYWAFDDGPGRSSGGSCALDMTCDQSQNGGYDLAILGPGWLDADAGLNGNSTIRP